MTDFRDDPRDVLALLNSLGFVGITAPQLKAFMKDLKMHRKIKEREKQQWKEETRKKILMKQERLLNEMLCDTVEGMRLNLPQNISSSDMSSQQQESLVRIRVHCVSEDKENEIRHSDQELMQKREMDVKKEKVRKDENRETVSSAEGISTRRRRERSKSYERSRLNEVSTDSSQYVPLERGNVSPRKKSRRQVQRNHKVRSPVRPLSAPEFTNGTSVIPKIERSKSVASDPTGLVHTRNNPSRCSTRSQAKSFIRPWRLQPEAQRAASARKSDPVALYQKYQQEWKQISFPGEDQHARVRWAVREKMLGTDPNPRPILKKSQSLMSIKKR